TLNATKRLKPGWRQPAAGGWGGLACVAPCLGFPYFWTKAGWWRQALRWSAMRRTASIRWRGRGLILAWPMSRNYYGFWATKKPIENRATYGYCTAIGARAPNPLWPCGWRRTACT